MAGEDLKNARESDSRAYTWQRWMRVSTYDASRVTKVRVHNIIMMAQYIISSYNMRHYDGFVFIFQ